MKKISLSYLMMILAVIGIVIASSAFADGMLDLQVFDQPDIFHKEMPRVGNGQLYHIDLNNFQRLS